MSARQNNTPYKGVFEGLDFEPYEYQHYPLLMRDKQGKPRRVTSEEEEEAAKAAGFAIPEGIGKPVTITTAELAEKNDEIEKLKAALEEAKAALQAGAKPASAPPAKP